MYRSMPVHVTHLESDLDITAFPGPSIVSIPNNFGTILLHIYREDNNLTANQYNWLGTIFYLSYLVFEYPQNLALQRFPVGKWMSVNIFIWSIALCCHAACHNFAGLFVGSITAGFMIVSSMFYTRREVSFLCLSVLLTHSPERNKRFVPGIGISTAQIISVFISFGVLHIKTTTFHPWQWLMIITGLITLVCAVMFWMIEALLDYKTWLFAVFSALDNVPNSLTNQRTIIVSSFGFTNLQTTLLACVDGVVEIVTIWTGVTIAARIPNSRAYVSFIYFIPNILGVFLINFLPWENKVGLLFAQWLTGIGTTGFDGKMEQVKVDKEFLDLTDRQNRDFRYVL
ncbi:MFS general substrate transporter [Dendrothele bispora CBS 962.96]|uniref:MFS general substrate transporter n=1 Tax=Dendrothele bispora (strain CBS 962.96) TaxID=1314807 RepID=A0A4S8MWT4_DENBC|nr:MFS general substrate transporter [Dendrothele bispora CBS 962.96]